MLGDRRVAFLAFALRVVWGSVYGAIKIDLERSYP